MILKTMDFDKFYAEIADVFKEHFHHNQIIELIEYVTVLSDANFKCYRANMLVIETRKLNESAIMDELNWYKLISDMEWVARSVGEYRVSSKARINKFISRTKSNKEITAPNTWVSDDIVYSIGEMMDRLSIEVIKREDFFKNKRPMHMMIASQELSHRVERYLKAKLKEIDRKGFYECIHEQRTYDLEGITEELVI